MNKDRLPPGQHEIESIMRWNLDHPGIVPQNPDFDPESWELIVDGEVGDPLTLSCDEFSRLPVVESRCDFHCVEGWSIRDCLWSGVRFSTLIDIVKPKEDAEYLFVESYDGYTTSFTLGELAGDGVLLASGLNGEPLEVPLGGPVRLIVSDMYAYKSAMWVKRMTFTGEKELGYWEKKGYSDTADVWKNDRRVD